MTYLRVGNWTQQEIHDFEDCINMWRFGINGNRIYVKYSRKEKNT